MRTAVWVGALAVLATGGTSLAQERKPDVLAKLEGHRGGVSAMAFNPNSNFKLGLFATAAGNGTVRLWDSDSGRFLGVLDNQKHNGARVNNLTFSANGLVLSSSSKNTVAAWDFTPPRPEPILPDLKSIDPKTIDPKDPKTFPKMVIPPPDFQWFLRPGARIPLAFEDPLGADPMKIGTVTGDNRRIYYSATEGARITVNSRVLAESFGTDTGDVLRSSFTPWAMAAMPDVESELVAMYGLHKEAGESQPAIALVGLGDPKVVGRGVVGTPAAGRPVTINFAPDRKWLVACNGEDLMYWRVPGSQVVSGEPKVLPGAYVAAAGPGNRIAYASPPEAGRKAKVTVVDVSGSQPKTLATYTTDIDRVSVLAFSKDGSVLAVADDVEGVVQLWAMDKK
jgi:WD40 repeat protein